MADTEVKKYTQKELDAKARTQVRKLAKLELELAETQKALATNPQFVAFLDTQKKLQKQTDEFWAKVKQQMIDSGIKNIKGDWGWITLGEQFKYKVTDASKVPEEFTFEDLDYEALKDDIDTLDEKYKTVGVDLAAIKEDVELTSEVPDGVEQTIQYSLRKKIEAPKEIL